MQANTAVDGGGESPAMTPDSFFIRIDGISTDEISANDAHEIADDAFDALRAAGYDPAGVIPILNERAEPRLRPVGDENGGA